MKVKRNLSDLCYQKGCLHLVAHQEMMLVSTLEKCSSEHTCGEVGIVCFCREEEEVKTPSKEKAVPVPA